MKKEKKQNPTKPQGKPPGVKGEHTTDENQTSPGIVAHGSDKQK